MINFFRSAFTSKEHPWRPDPTYKWKGGFVGEPGEVYHVRSNLESRCRVVEDATGTSAEFFLGSPCRSEYTIARRNLFQVPSSEYRMVFSRKSCLRIARRPSDESEPIGITSLAEDFQDHSIAIRTYDETEDLTTAQAISALDWVEFILRREVEAAPEERSWLDQPRGRDRLELVDPDNIPAGYPAARPKPLVFNETWGMEAANVMKRALNV